MTDDDDDNERLVDRLASLLSVDAQTVTARSPLLTGRDGSYLVVDFLAAILGKIATLEDDLDDLAKETSPARQIEGLFK